MSIITVPAGLVAPAGCTIGQARYDLTESSDSTGSEAARLLGPPRWSMSLRSIDAMTPAEAGLWEAMVLQLRGRVNHLAVHDFGRPAPAGTLRGSPTLNASASAGATSIVLTGVRPANNLLTQTRAFGASGWSAINSGTVTDNTATDPFGNVSADTLTDSNGAASAGRRQTVTVPNDSTTYCYSLYVKKTSGGTSHTLQGQLQFQGGSATSKVGRINTDLGTVLAGTGITVTDVDANWWRVSFAHTNDSSGNTTLRFDIFPAVNTYGGTSADPTDTGSAIVACAQLEIGTTASAYAPPTLLSGDWLQIGTGVGTSQLVKAVADATAAIDGTMTVTFEPPLRTAFSAGAAVACEKPVAYFKQTSAPSWSYRIGRTRKQGAFALDLLESWT
jgi:hypothetical protein